MRPHGGAAAAALLTTAKALLWVQVFVEFAGAVPVSSTAQGGADDAYPSVDDDYYYAGCTRGQPECDQIAPYNRRGNALAIAQSVVGGAGLLSVSQGFIA